MRFMSRRFTVKLSVGGGTKTEEGAQVETDCKAIKRGGFKCQVTWNTLVLFCQQGLVI